MNPITVLEYENALKIIEQYDAQLICKHEHIEHKIDLNSYPYGEDYEFDVCLDCGRMINLINLRTKR